MNTPYECPGSASQTDQSVECILAEVEGKPVQIAILFS